MAVYDIPESLMGDMDKKIRRIVRKCEKGNVSYIYEVSDPFIKEVHKSGVLYRIQYVHVTIDCKFSIHGWSVLGTVSRKDGIFQVYFNDPSLIPQYKDCDFYCEHCHSHRNRNTVVILEDAEGRKIQVGSTCVKEFTHGLDGELIAAYTELLAEMEKEDDEFKDPDENFCVSCSVPFVLVKKVVAGAACSIRQYGFVPSDDLNATRKDISRCIDRGLIEPQDEEIAGKAIEWCKNISDDDAEKSSYLYDLREICRSEVCTYRHYGMLASLIPTYGKAVKKSEKENAEKEDGKYIGNEGDKIECLVTLESVPSFESMYGTVYIYIMRDSDRNILVWKTSKRAGLQIADTFFIKGTIKDHEEYHGKKQTVLTRCKISK